MGALWSMCCGCGVCPCLCTKSEERVPLDQIKDQLKTGDVIIMRCVDSLIKLCSLADIPLTFVRMLR